MKGHSKSIRYRELFPIDNTAKKKKSPMAHQKQLNVTLDIDETVLGWLLSLCLLKSSRCEKKILKKEYKLCLLLFPNLRKKIFISSIVITFMTDFVKILPEGIAIKGI